MQRTALTSLVLLPFLLIAGAMPGAADTLDVGDSGGYNRFPFGFDSSATTNYQSGADYQQLFSAQDFATSPILISAISFASSSNLSDAVLASYSLDVHLGVAATSASAPSTTFAANRGAPYQDVFSGPYAFAPQNNDVFDLILNFSSPFLYDPSTGDLLLDVRLTGPTTIAGTALYFDGDLSATDSRVYNATASASTGSTNAFTLYTEFTYTPQPASPVPEPTTTATLIFAAAVGFLLRKRGRNWMAVLVITSLASLRLGAATLVVGANDGPDNANGFPFGTNGGVAAGYYDPLATFQQIYGASAFSGPITITGIAFASSSGQGGGAGTFTDSLTLGLGTAAQSVSSPSDTYSGNRGPDFATVFTGPVTANLTEGDAFDLSFLFTTPFQYNPANGDLLFQVIIGTPVTYTGSFLYFDAGNSPAVSEVFNTSLSTTGNSAPGYGLLTDFTYTTAARSATPEPGTSGLICLGAVSVVGIALRKDPLRKS